jgi:hypothetical protein
LQVILLKAVIMQFADVSKAGKMLGYNPKTDIGTGLRRFVEWFNRELIDDTNVLILYVADGNN